MNRFNSSNPKFIDDIKFIEDYNKCTSSSLKLIVDKEIILAGNLNFSAIIAQEKYEGSFVIKVIFSYDYPTTIPKTYNVNNEIEKEYGHFLQNSNLLCLGVPTDIFLKINHNDSIEYFLKYILIPYYVSYQYWDNNKGKKLFNERSHGITGIQEYYLDYFHVNSIQIMFRLLSLLEIHRITNKDLCPCRSGRKYTKCHYNSIQQLKLSPYAIDEYHKMRNKMLKDSINSVLCR
ncbi:MAG: SEC-C domain-containing protein [Candidatus Cloacimonetes bacterium]|nr:SEC-C domain-containing protein [Candidatus Cloacimonadota bacterium]